LPYEKRRMDICYLRAQIALEGVHIKLM
jgi:hypothetical protein